MGGTKHLLRRSKDERGQALVISAITITVLLGMSAVVLDVGRAYLGQRSLQAAADASALAGAQALPSSADATAVARQYTGEDGKKNARVNLPGVTSTITTECRAGAPCSPVNAVVVEQRAKVPTHFAKVFGIEELNVRARSVAMIRSGGTPWAIFAYDSDCGSLVLKVNGNDTVIDGAMRSNGKLEVNGENLTAGYTSAGGPNNCQPVVNGQDIDLGGGSDQPVIDTTLHDWPRYYYEHEFHCDFTAAKFTFNTTGQTIPTGTYCATELFEANGNNQRGEITVLAPEIKIDGDNQFFRPHELDVLFYGTGTKELILDGNGYDWEGVIFSPRSRIKINGDASSVLTGMIEGLEVEVNGNGFRMNGNGPASGGKQISLVE
jgi:Putative Flp pilus-assembly TadE/G-like